MNDTFAEYLNTVRPNDEMIEVAARAYLSELTNDELPAEIRKKLLSVSAGNDELDSALSRLEHSPLERRDADLAFLAWAWDQPANRERIAAAFRGAESKLPAFESALLALIALYGMYLLTTRGIRKVTRIVKKKPDGSFEEQNVTDYESPVGPMSLVGRMFSGVRGKEDDGSNCRK